MWSHRDGEVSVGEGRCQQQDSLRRLNALKIEVPQFTAHRSEEREVFGVESIPVILSTSG